MDAGRRGLASKAPSHSIMAYNAAILLKQRTRHGKAIVGRKRQFRHFRAQRVQVKDFRLCPAKVHRIGAQGEMLQLSIGMGQIDVTAWRIHQVKIQILRQLTPKLQSKILDRKTGL